MLIEISTDYTTSNYGGSGSGCGGSYGDPSMGDREASEGSERPDSADFDDTNFSFGDRESGSGDLDDRGMAERT
ncbi:MAG: hypothetical protein LUF27_09715 [Lachnospiraceae bacterium]|nr:hypothetical protein [Lachnospiraceae bacterium]